MKLVKEHINEKFSEESDPVEDMGIGIGKLLDDYKKKNRKQGWTQGHPLDDLDIARELISDITGTWYKSKKNLSDDDFKIHMKMLEYLLKQGNVDVNLPNTNIFINVLNLEHPKTRRLDLFKLLIKYGLKIKTLDELISKDDDASKIQAFKLLIKAGILQRKEKFAQIFKNNVLYWSSKGQNVELVKFALNEGADPSNRNYYALQSALEHNQVELIKIFIKILQNDPKFK